MNFTAEIGSFSVPVLTIIRNARGPCRKTLFLNEAGKLDKIARATIASGTARRVSVESMAELAELRASLSSSEVLAYGTFEGKAIQPLRLKSDPAVEFGKAIARSKSFFAFPDPAILFLDCDATQLTALEIDAILGSILPGWLTTERLYDASSGSFIFSAEGKSLSSGTGWHIYAAVSPGVLIPELVGWLHRKLWQAGHGHIEVSKPGSLLERGLIDVTCCQPERLDFTAPAKLLDRLTRRAPAPLRLEGHPILPVDALPLGEGKQAHTALVRAAKGKLKPEADATRKRTIGAAVEADIAAGVERSQAERRWNLAYEDRVLTNEFVIELEDRETVTVSQILANPDKFEGERCCDPIEPDYRGDSRVAIIYPSRGLIWSHAHGGVSYFLGEPQKLSVKEIFGDD
jgi:hypothetical protein